MQTVSFLIPILIPSFFFAGLITLWFRKVGLEEENWENRTLIRDYVVVLISLILIAETAIGTVLFVHATEIGWSEFACTMLKGMSVFG